MALSESFLRKVEDIETRLRMAPGSLLAVMKFETGGTFDPAERNRAGSGATGLIQFMPSTAKSLGTSTEALARMSPEDQLDYVEKYFQPYKGKLGTLDDTYMAVLYPKAIGKPEWYPLFAQGTKAYEQNAGLDRDKKGIVTKADAVSMVQRRSGQAPETMTAQATSRDAPASTPEPPTQIAAVELPPSTQGADWASVLFSGTPGSGGTDWASRLFG